MPNIPLNPSPADLLPHSGAMLLIDRIVSYSEQKISAFVKVSSKGFALRSNFALEPSNNIATNTHQVENWIALEYMAQTAGILIAYIIKEQNLSLPDAGFVVSARRCNFFTECFYLEQELNIIAALDTYSSPLFLFDCYIEDSKLGTKLAEAKLSIHSGG